MTRLLQKCEADVSVCVAESMLEVLEAGARFSVVLRSFTFNFTFTFNFSRFAFNARFWVSVGKNDWLFITPRRVTFQVKRNSVRACEVSRRLKLELRPWRECAYPTCFDFTASRESRLKRRVKSST